MTAALRNAGLLLLISAAAFLALLRARGADRAQEQPVAAPMDLVWDEADDNGIPKNPQWRHHLTTGSLPDPEQLCPGGVGGFSRCTTQPVSLDTSFVCALLPGYTTGHVNWPIPATYEGVVYWADQSCIICDNDVSLELVPAKQDAGLTNRNDGSIHIEFDAGETVARFSTTWWRSFAAATSGVGQPLGQFAKFAGAGAGAGAAIGAAIGRTGKDAAIGAAGGAAAGAVTQSVLRTRAKSADKAVRALVDGKFAIVSGMMGLDCEHTCAAEIHPVWAIAINVRQDPSDDVWAIFVRNSGNEGMCSDQQHYAHLPHNRYAFRLPWRKGASDAGVIDTKTKFLANFSLAHDVTVLPGQAVAVEFEDLPTPDTRPLLHGELHLRWAFEGGVTLADAKREAAAAEKARKTPPPSVTPPAAQRQPELERSVALGEAKMSPEKRKQYRKALPASPPPASDKIPEKKPRTFLMQPPPPAPATQPPTIESVPDPRSSSLRAERMKALCASYDPNTAEERLKKVCAAVMLPPVQK